MAIIEGFRVRNFRPLRDIAMGRLSGGQGKPRVVQSATRYGHGDHAESMADSVLVSLEQARCTLQNPRICEHAATLRTVVDSQSEARRT